MRAPDQKPVGAVQLFARLTIDIPVSAESTVISQDELNALTRRFRESPEGVCAMEAFVAAFIDYCGREGGER